MINRIAVLGLAAAAAMTSTLATAQEFRINFAHYLSNSPFV